MIVRRSDQAAPFCLVYEDDDGALLGLTHYLFHGTAWTPEPRCYLNDLYTTLEARGKDVGRALIEVIYVKVDAHKCRQVYRFTKNFNEAG